MSPIVRVAGDVVSLMAGARDIDSVRPVGADGAGGGGRSILKMQGAATIEYEVLWDANVFGVQDLKRHEGR